MAFDLDQFINCNFKEVLKNYLKSDTLENHYIEVKQFPIETDVRSFNDILELDYKMILECNDFISIMATFSENKSSSICQKSNQKIFIYKTLATVDFEYFKTNNLNAESKKYLLTISDKNKKSIYSILLIISMQETYSVSHDFTKQYLLNSYHEKKVIPNREDSTYKKIESFKPHELTYKIFYEMATRNNNVKKILYALSYLHDINTLNKKEIKIDTVDCYFPITGRFSSFFTLELL